MQLAFFESYNYFVFTNYAHSSTADPVYMWDQIFVMDVSSDDLAPKSAEWKVRAVSWHI